MRKEFCHLAKDANKAPGSQELGDYTRFVAE